MEGVGVTAASSAVASTYLTATEKQQFLGTVTIAVDVTFPYSSVSIGVNIARLDGLASPLTEIATAIGVTSPPSGIAMLPLKVIAYLAKQLLVIPLRIKIPVSSS